MREHARAARVTPTGWKCPTVRWHRPAQRVRQGHHAWPMYLNGPEKGVKVGVCGGCHDMTHVLIELGLDAGLVVLTPQMHLGYPERVVELALYGLACHAEQRQVPVTGWMASARMAV